ncbi:MAG: transcriptional regulator [Bacteroidia bacterium]
MFRELDPLLHSQLRLGIMSILMNLEEAEFTYIREKTGATAGNISVQIDKLKKAGYLTVEKTFRNNYPLTVCRKTKKGARAFEEYVEILKGYLGKH